MPYKLLGGGTCALILTSILLLWVRADAKPRDAGNVANLVVTERPRPTKQHNPSAFAPADTVLPSSTAGTQLADLLLGIDRPLVSATKSQPELLAWQDQDRLPGGSLRGLRLDSEGLLVGQLGLIDLDARTVAGAAMSIDFLRAGQQVLGDVALNPAGVFQAQLEPDVYSMIAAGNGGFLGLSLRVLGGGASEALSTKRRNDLLLVAAVEDEPEVQFRAAALPRENFNELGRIIQRHRIFSVPVTPEEEPAADSTLPIDIMGLSDFEVRLRPGGRLIGRAERLKPRRRSSTRVRRMNVYFLQEGAQVARVQVGTNGQFEVDGLPEGVLSIVVASREGFAAFSVLALLPENTTDATTTRLVSTEGQEVSALEPGEIDLFIPLVDPEDFEAMRQSMQRLPTEDAPDLANALQEAAPEELLPAPPTEPLPLTGPFGPGGTPVGGGGAGGTVPGIGGLGLAGLAGLAGLTSDDQRTIVLASPFFP